MKSFKLLSMMTVVLLLFGVVGVASADNAAEVVLEVSYPFGQDFVRSDAVAGQAVNVYATLKDANGAPATAGPEGEALSSVTATLSTTLGRPASIDRNNFVSDAGQLLFNFPAGNGPSASANVVYTLAVPGMDSLIISVATSGDPLIATAEARVVASAGVGLTARLYRNGSPSSIIYTSIDPQQNNGWADTANCIAQNICQIDRNGRDCRTIIIQHKRTAGGRYDYVAVSIGIRTDYYLSGDCL